MELIQAEHENEWHQAENLLSATILHLNSIDAGLWSPDQISSKRLREEYELRQLFWLEHQEKRIGLVFLMDIDPTFWPEPHIHSSLFFHKLAIHPDFSGKGLGKIALDEIRRYAKRNGYEWVRLDCDDRPPLHRFYQENGYSLIDIKPMDKYMVARYELQVTRVDTDRALTIRATGSL